MKNFRLFFLLIGLLLWAQGVLAQAIYFGIPSGSFSPYAKAQFGSQWCWAASMEMIFNFYGVNISQAEIVNRTYGGLVDFPGGPEIITANLNNLSIDQSGRVYRVSAQYGWGVPDPIRLINTLAVQQPIMIGYNTGSSAHAVVVTACSYVNTALGPQITSLVVRDPFPTPQNIANQGRVEYLGVDLGPRIIGYWFVRID